MIHTINEKNKSWRLWGGMTKRDYGRIALIALLSVGIRGILPPYTFGAFSILIDVAGLIGIYCAIRWLILAVKK